jgi:hypothetical protein
LKATSTAKAKSSPEMNNVFFIANYQEYVILYNSLKYIDFWYLLRTFKTGLLREKRHGLSSPASAWFHGFQKDVSASPVIFHGD